MAEGGDLRDEVALSCRVLAAHGQGHLTFGHVSARIAETDGIVIKTAGLGLEEVRADAIAEADAQGRALDPTARMHDELPLHTEVYGARADVGAIVHTHPTSSIVFSLLRDRFPITSQDAVPFWNRIGFYARADLVTTVAEGKELAACLGAGRAAILHAHGLVAVGADVAEATVNAVLLDRALRTTLAVMRSGGTVAAMRDDDIAALDEHFERSRRARVDSIWQYLVRTLPG
jgi:L-fuculose-phosphate aldolase